MLATHREELEERILENLPLLVLIGNQWNINFAQVLREQEDQTDRAVGKTEDMANVSLTVVSPKAWPSLTAILAFFHTAKLGGGQSKCTLVILHSKHAQIMLVSAERFMCK